MIKAKFYSEDAGTDPIMKSGRYEIRSRIGGVVRAQFTDDLDTAERMFRNARSLAIRRCDAAMKDHGPQVADAADTCDEEPDRSPSAAQERQWDRDFDPDPIDLQDEAEGRF